MILQSCIDVAICTGILVGVVALCLLGRLAMVGRDAGR